MSILNHLRHLLVCMLVSGCAYQPVSALYRNTQLSENDLKQGEIYHVYIQEEVGLTRHQQQPALQKIADYLSAQLPDSPIRVKVWVTHEAGVQATAAPNGNLYLTPAIIELASNEAELAVILAHEIGHVVGRHYHQAKLRGSHNASQTLKLKHHLEGADRAALPDSIAKVIHFGDSREAERQADLLVIDLLYLAGYDLNAVISLMNKLLELKQNTSTPAAAELFSTHPNLSKRLNYLQTLVSKLGPRQNKPQTFILIAQDQDDRQPVEVETAL